MSVMEIVLIIIGAGILLLGYFLPAGKKDVDEEVHLISEAEIRKMVDGEAESVRERISDIVDETIGYSIEKTERAMERLANEKIMAINEYSDTVLEEINKNHKEVTFLYDMLNDKHENLLTGVREASQLSEEIRQTVRDAEITAQEAAKKAQEAEEAVEQAIRRIRSAETAAREAQEAVQEAVGSVMGAVEDTRTDLWSLQGVRSYPVDRAGEPQAENEPMPDEGDFFYGQEPQQEPYEEPAGEQAEEIDFQPIKPRRVEIIHEPDADYVAGEQEMSTSAAFAELGIFGKREQTAGRVFDAGRELEGGRDFGDMEEPEVDRDFDGGREPAAVPEEPRGVDIRFAQRNDGGRNSNERILELHKAGKSNMAIAKELGLGLGEVKLVIDLFEGV